MCGRNSIRSILSTAALTACLIGSCAALAQQTPTSRSVRVRISDLNLNSPEGTAELYKRIRNAASRACAAHGVTMPLDLSLAKRECRRDAIARAVDSVRNERLSAIHKQHVSRGAG